MNYFCPGSVNTYWGPGPVNTNWGPGLVNTNLGPGPVNTSLGAGPGPANTNTLNWVTFGYLLTSYCFSNKVFLSI